MKNRFYGLTIMSLLLYLSIGCAKNTPENNGEIQDSDSENICTPDDTVCRNNIEISNLYKQIKDSIIREMQNVHFFSS
ncbi:MAG: hypothetical protein K2J12_08570, partial [Muribaculaceae bacterium]|nr:hypothetical protein [Muribaculaceae bacterium]